MKYTLMFLCILFFAGCKTCDIPHADAAHPANPQAASSSEIKLNQNLHVDKHDLPKVPSEMKKENMKHM